MFRLIVGIFAVFGVIFVASAWWPRLFEPALHLGGISISGVVVLGIIVFCLAFSGGE